MAHQDLLELIDNADVDYSVSAHAMRWRPEPPLDVESGDDGMFSGRVELARGNCWRLQHDGQQFRLLVGEVNDGGWVVWDGFDLVLSAEDAAKLAGALVVALEYPPGRG